MSDEALHWLAKEALRRLDAALLTATPVQKYFWQYDVRLHIEEAAFGATRRDIALTNGALFYVRHKNKSIPEAFQLARKDAHRPLR